MQVNFSTQYSDFNPIKTQAIEKTRFVGQSSEAAAGNTETLSETDSTRTDDFKKLQSSLAEHDITLKFRQDDETGQLIVELVNDKTGEAIRQIPSEVSVKLSKMSVKVQGHFVDEQV